MSQTFPLNLIKNHVNSYYCSDFNYTLKIYKDNDQGFMGWLKSAHGSNKK